MKIVEELEYISVAESKAKLSEIIKRSIQNSRRFGITSHGKPKAVIICYQDYLKLRSPKTAKRTTLKKTVQKEVVEYVTSKFNESLLTRKGQKEYKREKVKR